MIGEQLIDDMREYYGSAPYLPLDLSRELVQGYVNDLNWDIKLLADSDSDLTKLLEKDVLTLNRVLSKSDEELIDEFSVMPIRWAV